jgi:hypothetical protein
MGTACASAAGSAARPATSPSKAMTMDRNDTTLTNTTRTHGQAVAEVQYAVEFGRLNERFWQRLDTVLNLMQVLAGALALAGAFSAGQWLPVAGVVLAVVSALQITLAPGRRAAGFLVARRDFSALLMRAWKLDPADLDAELEALRAQAPQGLELLSAPAFNNTSRRNGHDTTLPERWPHRLARALA